MQSSPRKHALRPPRTPVPKDVPANVRLRRLGEEEAAAIDAELIDISRGGTKLCIATPLLFEESVDMHVEIPSIEMDCHVLATVRHIREAEDGRWIIGCSVDPPLDERAISGLVTQAAVDRRRSPREPIDLPATVQRQLGRVDANAVMRNLSRGGFCVLLEGACDIGECIHITLAAPGDDSATIESRVHWQLQSQDGYLTGCKFLGTGDYDVVRAAFAAQAASDAAKVGRPPRRQAGLGIVTWAAVSCATCAVSLLFMQGSSTGLVGDETRAMRSGPKAAVISNETEDIGEAPPSQAERRTPRPPPVADVQRRPVDRAPAPPERETVLREWVDDTGHYRVTAKLVAVHDDGIVLRRKDGKEIHVPLDRLSAADLDFAKRQQRFAD